MIGALIVEPFRTKEAEIILRLIYFMKNFSPVEVAAATVAHKIPKAAKIRRFLASASPIFLFLDQDRSDLRKLFSILQVTMDTIQ